MLVFQFLLRYCPAHVVQQCEDFSLFWAESNFQFLTFYVFLKLYWNTSLNPLVIGVYSIACHYYFLFPNKMPSLNTPTIPEPYFLPKQASVHKLEKTGVPIAEESSYENGVPSSAKKRLKVRIKPIHVFILRSESFYTSFEHRYTIYYLRFS